MPADDERREVAERLRRSWPSVADEKPVNRALRFYLAVNSAIFDLRECDEKDTIDMLDRLADLIDPGDTSLSCRDTVACDLRASESGQNRDTNRDTVQKKSPAVQKVPECDREALLAEAKEAEKCAWYFALDHDEDELRDRLTEAAEDFSDMARRIREACGEVVE